MCSTLSMNTKEKCSLQKTLQSMYYTQYYVYVHSSISRCYKSQFTYLMFLFSPFHNTRRILFPLFFQWILISLCRSNNKGKCNCVSFSLLLVVHTTIYFTMGASYLKKNGRSTCSYHLIIVIQRFSLSTQVDAIRECRLI